MSSLSRALLAAVLAAAAFLGAARTAAATEQPITVLPVGFTTGAAAPARRSPLFDLGAAEPSRARVASAPPFDFPAPDPAAGCVKCNFLSWHAPPPFILEGAS
jgi:hypothetical protein